MKVFSSRAIRKIVNNLKHKKMFMIFITAAIFIFIIGIGIYRIKMSNYTVFEEIISKIQKLNEYEIDAVYYDEEKIIEGTEKIIYVNNTNKTLDSLYFHIYPNVFKKRDTVPFDKNEIEIAYINGFEPGYINIKSVKSTKEGLSYLIIGKGNSILKVKLNEGLEPEDSIKIYINFMVKIPPASGRFGYGKNTINIANWYPIAAVIDNSGWNLEPYYSIGDPFYSDVSNYRVTMTMPQNYIIASTGDLIKRESIEGNYKWSFEAKKVRDFAMIASSKYKIAENDVDGIAVRSYYFDDESAEISLNAAKDAIKIFNKIFGKYPYKHFSVAASDFFIGGMEYPKLVFIDEGMYKGNDEILEYIIVHETAHQWWYGLVGNNEVKEAWLDEALTEYSTLLYYENKYGKEVKNKVYKEIILGGYNRFRSSIRDNKEVLLKDLGKFNNSREYHALVYCKGAMFFESLRRELGDKVFFNILKVYYDKYKYKNATTEDFIKLCEIVSDRELKSFFNKWLLGQKE
ncbi:M1 family metallopeptidase [Caminicella sporogenes]|uniref:M1 family metallopeptidase n=1 Tax=Caminicella sporogenes TaxID=166485 RepID=UPI002541BE06|nr:M1 family metallopeptidase [Caminicella sporogenes]WIF95827.1 M1 family metallopeptidase [Caminicella sporogenes]